MTSSNRHKAIAADDMSAGTRYAGFASAAFGSAAQQAMAVAAEYEAKVRQHGQARIDRCVRLAEATLLPFEHWLDVSDSELVKAEQRYVGQAPS